mgnify:CR=1 FL=1
MIPGKDRVVAVRWQGLVAIAALMLLVNFLPGSSPASTFAAPATAPEGEKIVEPAPDDKTTAGQSSAPAPTSTARPKKTKASQNKPKAPKLAPGQRVNLNTASPKELEKIPGIGRVKAQAIMKGRPYKSPEDIMKIKGIKKGTYQKIKEYITVK